MTSTRKKRLILNTVSVDLGCSSCRKPIFSNIFHPKSKSKHRTAASSAVHHLYSTSSTSSNSISPNPPSWDYNNSHRKLQGFGRVGGESVAVEKDSDDPYLDFRHSMLQMILENEIYSKDDLKELLNCFLQLNSPYYHGIIVRAFTEIWNGVFSVKSPSACSGGGGGGFSGGSQNLHYYYGC